MGKITRRAVVTTLFAVGTAAALVKRAEAGGRSEIDYDARAALQRLRALDSGTRALAARAIAILMFPNIIKGGFIVGGQYGEGALIEHGKTTGYFSIAAGSLGLQAGGEALSYALLFFRGSALQYLKKNDGWTIGTGPNIVVLDTGGAASVTNLTATHDVVAIPFGLKGLMAGINLEGSKITRISPEA